MCADMLPCPVPSWPQICKLVSRSDLVLISFWMLTMPWIFVLSRSTGVSETVAHLCFCLVRINMPLLVCFLHIPCAISTAKVQKQQKTSYDSRTGWAAIWRSVILVRHNLPVHGFPPKIPGKMVVNRRPQTTKTCLCGHCRYRSLLSAPKLLLN